MNKNEDIAWVTRCALFDDRRAFACLVDKYQVRLKRFFLNLTGGDPVLSDDLAQETFIKVYYNLRSYKGLSSFSTWIYRVAYNVFYDELRKSREWEDASVDEAANLLEQPPECVDRNIDISSFVYFTPRGANGDNLILRRGPCRGKDSRDYEYIGRYGKVAFISCKTKIG